jgi:Fe2+ or Zn2+ uptake regulation protein
MMDARFGTRANLWVATTRFLEYTSFRRGGGAMLDTWYGACYNHYKFRDITNKPMRSLESLCAQLKAHGRRVTPQRRAIIQVLLDDGTHVTADHVYTQARDMMPNLSPATVYNTLHELAEMGILMELDLGLGERRYDIMTADHAHLVCLECGHIEDVPYDSSALELLPEHACGFKVLDHRVTFRGYCPNCAALKDREN